MIDVMLVTSSITLSPHTSQQQVFATLRVAPSSRDLGARLLAFRCQYTSVVVTLLIADPYIPVRRVVGSRQMIVVQLPRRLSGLRRATTSHEALRPDITAPFIVPPNWSAVSVPAQ